MTDGVSVGKQSVASQGEAKRFATEDLLSVSTGVLVSERGIEAVYDVMNFLTSESLFTHQLAVYMKPCSAELRRQHPQLPSAKDAADVDKTNWRKWRDRQVAKLGTHLEITPTTTPIRVADPFSDLAAMMDRQKPRGPRKQSKPTPEVAQ